VDPVGALRRSVARAAGTSLTWRWNGQWNPGSHNQTWGASAKPGLTEPSAGAGRAGREPPGAAVSQPGVEEQQAAQR
jgi:hypothetical protein